MKRVLLLVVIFLSIKIHGQNYPTRFELYDQYKKSVVFAYSSPVRYPQLKDCKAIGTAFLMLIRHPNDSNMAAKMFVTAKHVILDPAGRFLKQVFFRINNKDSFALVRSDIITEGPYQNLYIHPDPNVDVAIILGFPTRRDYDINYLDESFLIDRTLYGQYHEGSDVFFIGLFTPFVGSKSNHPIMRFGKISLIPKEKINIRGRLCDVTLIEAMSFGGNSGSPVFYERQEGRLNVLKIGGIMNGSYNDLTPLEIMLTKDTIPVARSTMGISFITPSYYILEIIRSKPFQDRLALGNIKKE